MGNFLSSSAWHCWTNLLVNSPIGSQRRVPFLWGSIPTFRIGKDWSEPIRFKLSEPLRETPINGSIRANLCNGFSCRAKLHCEVWRSFPWFKLTLTLPSHSNYSVGWERGGKGLEGRADKVYEISLNQVGSSCFYFHTEFQIKTAHEETFNWNSVVMSSWVYFQTHWFHCE